jgi:hypothetical protein
MTQSLVDGVPTRRLMDDPERWSSGLFYDWTHGLADAIHHAGKDNASVHTLVRVEVCTDRILNTGQIVIQLNFSILSYFW